MRTRIDTLIKGALAASVLLAAGCDLAPSVQRVGGSDLTHPTVRLYEDPKMTEKAVDPKTAKTIAQYDDILTKFMGERERIMTLPETDQHLNQIEQFSRWTGRYLELVDLYRASYEAEGAKHYTSPRLVMAYLNLGQRAPARKILDEAMRARPDDARVYFLNGYLIRFEGPAEDERIRVVRDNWTKALQLDPQLKYLYPIKADIVSARLKEMNGFLGTPASPVPAPSERKPPSNAGSQPVVNPSPQQSDLSDLPKAIIEAESLLASGPPQAAFNAFSRIQNKYPKSREAMIGRAISGWRSISQVDRDKAMSLVDAVISREDLSAEELARLGNFCFSEVKMPQKAIGLWRRATEKDPDYAAREKLADRIKKASGAAP